MASLIPAFHAAMHDPRLRGHARDVYIHLHDRLDVLEYRPVKSSQLEIVLQMRDTYVAAMLEKLVRLGYLQRSKRSAGRVRLFRLFYSVPFPPKTE